MEKTLEKGREKEVGGNDGKGKKECKKEKKRL